MAEHCDRCGTQIDPDQHRHQWYRFEDPDDPDEVIEGRLCEDCFWEFEEWLEGRSIDD